MTTEEYVVSTDAGCYIGRVASVDTNRALILAESPEVVQMLTVSDLVAIQGATPQEFLIGIIEKVKRSIGSPVLIESDTESEDDEQDFDVVVDHDVVQVALIGTYWEVLGDKRQIFKRGAKYFPKVDKQVYLIKEESLEKLMSVVASDTPEEIQLVLGTYGNTQSKAVANGDKLFQRHAALLGSTGSGKSWTVASLLEQAAKLEHTNIILFDLHGEYKTLTSECVEDGKEPIAEYYKIAGPADIENQKKSTVFVPHWLLNKDEMLALLLDRSDNNAPNQASRFTHHVRELKQAYLTKYGITDLEDMLTIDSPIPYSIHELLERLSADDIGTKPGAGSKPVKGDWNTKLTRFIGRLETKIEDKRNAFLFDKPEGAVEYNWLATYANQFLETKSDRLGIKVIDFSEVPSDILPVVIGVLTRFLYNVQFWRAEEDRTPIAFVCDEAHIYLPTKDSSDANSRIALDTFEKVAKEGRKYGVSLLVVSQRPSDVSRTILSQCNNLIALRLSNPQDQQVVHSMMPDSLSSLTSVLPILDTGEAIVLGDAVLLPSRIKLNEPNLKPASATKDFWKDWSNKESKTDSIVFAVESLRRQSRLR
tara:strand:+ start:2901 stop:4679 length:1779 start_codon:yes stop_codon:yes gene_type:complete